MRIPSKNIGGWASEIVSQCNSSRVQRLQSGSIFKSIYLTGDEQGDPQLYNETHAFLENLSAYLYSAVDLRFMLDCYGAASVADVAKMKAASSLFHQYFRGSGTDTLIEDATLWSLVKGKTYIKNKWTADGFRDSLIQPEFMGVLEENLRTLDEQDAFCHTMYVTPDRLWRMLKTHPDRDEMVRKAMKYATKGKNSDDPEHENTLRQIVVGSVYPYGISGQGNPVARGQLNWLSPPTPQFSAEIISSLIPIYELWVWDDERDNEKEDIDGEYTTIQFVGEDVVLRGELTHRNIFADQFSPYDKRRKSQPTKGNPLAGHHPFSEICPNELDGFHFGRSEILNVALLQKAINARINGIGMMLRRQEDPPKFFSGVQGIKSSAYSMSKKAGGYFTDSNPGAKAQDLYPQLPDGIWESLHEYQTLFDRMGGFTATMSGRGDKGVRSKEHAAALTQNASPRFKSRALTLERQIEALGSLKLDMLKAHCVDKITAWVPKEESGNEVILPPDGSSSPPVPNMVPVDFTFYDLPENVRVSVDSHSSSPAFGEETKHLMFDLFKTQAIDQEELIEHLHPPGAERMLEVLERKKFQQQQFMAQHPELAEKAASKGKK